MKKLKLNEPGWFQVTFGALLSAILGVALGAAVLVARPAVVVKAEPKEREQGAVYFIEGSRDGNRGRQALAKRQSFLAGESITVNEDEINTLVAAALKAAGPGAPAPSAPADSSIFPPGCRRCGSGRARCNWACRSPVPCCRKK